MAWAWRLVDDGFTGANGVKDSRADTVSDNRPRPPRGTRARGRADFRMDTVQRPTRTAVSSTLIVLLRLRIARMLRNFLHRAWAGKYPGEFFGTVETVEWNVYIEFIERPFLLVIHAVFRENIRSGKISPSDRYSRNE